MEQSNDQSLRLAVLIDADNASRTAMRDVMAEIAVYGTPTIKRIYGDWTTPIWPPGSRSCWRTPSPHPAVQLYHRKELHRFGYDHRRHGHPLYRTVRRFRTGVQRFRLHPSGHPAAGGGQEGHRHGGEEDAQSLHRGL